MKIARTLAFAALGMLAFAPPSVAILFVCPTDSPGPCTAQVLLPFPNQMIELYVQESNGVNVTINVSDGMIENFVLNDPPEVVQSHPSTFMPMPTQISIVGVRATPVDPPTTFKLGTLIVDATGGNTIVAVAVGSEGVAMGDVIELIDPANIAMPEPTQWLMLTAGSAALAALGRRRSRLAKHRV